MWKTSDELLTDIRDAHVRLKEGKTDPVTAHAEARILSTGAKVIAVQLEHAKATSRLVQGSAALPGFRLVEGV